MSFNGDPVFPQFVSNLIKTLQIDCVVETGTYLGQTTRFFASQVRRVDTIENSVLYYTTTHFDDCPNVTMHFGSSSDKLLPVLESLNPKSNVLLYLDAHWEENWPLLDELRAVQMSPFTGRSVIMIDDFKIDSRPDIPYDSYKGQDLDINYVHDALSLAIPNYCSMEWVPLPGHERCRGRLIAMPETSFQKVLDTIQTPADAAERPELP